MYQTREGGKTLYSLDQAARIVVSSTPRFAKMVSHKVVNSATTVVQRDIEENHGRHVSREFVRDLADAVGAIALISQDGWREAMTRTISLYDAEGQRRHTVYIGATPEYGKATFTKRMEQEISHVKKLYPEAAYVGIADGAQCNWTFLEAHTERQIVDFWHAAQYLAEVAQAAFPTREADRAEWLEERCHLLKHYPVTAPRILEEMEEIGGRKLPKAAKEHHLAWYG